MADVLHTADVHLTADAPERLAALEELLDLAEARDVAAVTIGGDLFHDPADVETLRGRLRNEVFTDRPYEVLLIPGNHDVEAFRGDLFFGDDCTAFAGDAPGRWTDPDGAVRITALPYRETADDDLLLTLRDHDPFDGADVLLFHGSLEAPLADAGTGEREARRYFPIAEETLVELGFDYYLAGHYHGPHRLGLPDGAAFTYPGTPASTRESETGRRRVSLLSATEGLAFEPLDSFHYTRETVVVAPGREDEVLERVSSWADAHAVAAADAAITVEGFIETDEETFHDRLTAASGPAAVRNETRNASHVLSYPLFRAFEAELAERDWDAETTAAVRERTIEAFTRLEPTGEV